jgi:hypothetical protein
MLLAAMILSPASLLTPRDSLLDQGERLLQSTATRTVLSFLIVLSVLPTEVYEHVLPGWLARRFDPFFLIVFLPELLLRTAILARRVRQHRPRLAEVLVLLADLVALLSFFPLASDFAWLRLLRLSRLVLLVGYWGRLAADLWLVLSSRERRYQIGLVLVLALVTSFVTAILLFELGPAYDYDDNGVVNRADLRFAHVFWWSFRQLPDPGNLITHPIHLAVVGASLVMTFSGMLLFSFVIGISAGVMGELMHRARERALGLREHTALIGIGSCSRLLVEDLLALYRKNRRYCRIAVLGSASEPPEWLETRAFKHVIYRSGDPMRVDDLKRVDVDSAKRVLIMTESGPAADARAVAAVLAVRTCTPNADVFLDVEHEKDFAAARMAGGPRTHVIGAGSLLGYLIAHNAVHPGAKRAVRQLLSHGGDDVYTYVYSPTERNRFCEDRKRFMPDTLFQEFLGQGVILLGAFVGLEIGDQVRQVRQIRIEDLKVVFNLFDVEDDAEAFFENGCLRSEFVHGFIGICVHWADLRGCALQLLDRRLPEKPLAPPPSISPVPLARTVPPRRVLICGASTRVPRVVSELVGYAGHVDITLLTRTVDQIASLEDGIRTAFDGALSTVPREKQKTWSVESLPEGRRIEMDFPCGRMNLRILALDWTDAGRLLLHPWVDLAQTDAVLFLPREQDDVTDGLVAIDCLRMADFFASMRSRMNPSLRVVALLGDPTKSDLLESRLDETAPENEMRFTVLSSERLRQGFAVRNLFVRGLSPLLLELLSVQGHHLQRLVPAWPEGRPPEGTFDVWDLVRYCIVHDRLLPIGFELSGSNEAILDASALRPGQRIANADLRAVYVVGSANLRSPAPMQ